MVGELLRRGLGSNAARDPEFFDRKAEVFDRLAVEHPEYAHPDESLDEMATTARQRARELREGQR
jgi:uncharacterized protein YigA (DUF484 family)